jgi:hypothetical protein
MFEEHDLVLTSLVDPVVVFAVGGSMMAEG